MCVFLFFHLSEVIFSNVTIRTLRDFPAFTCVDEASKEISSLNNKDISSWFSEDLSCVAYQIVMNLKRVQTLFPGQAPLSG